MLAFGRTLIYVVEIEIVWDCYTTLWKSKNEILQRDIRPGKENRIRCIV